LTRRGWNPKTGRLVVPLLQRTVTRVGVGGGDSSGRLPGACHTEGSEREGGRLGSEHIAV